MAEHNYVKKVEEYIKANAIPANRVTEVFVMHDSWCGILRGGRCNCDPEIRRSVAYFDPSGNGI